jgi:hypothetical protein
MIHSNLVEANGTSRGLQYHQMRFGNLEKRHVSINCCGESTPQNLKKTPRHMAKVVVKGNALASEIFSHENTRNTHQAARGY